MNFTTVTESIRSGTVNIQFYLPSTSSISNDVYISKLGNLKYNFDVPQDSKDPTAVGSKPGSIEVGLFQKIRDRELVDAFRELQPNERFLALLNFTEHGSGFDGQMPFYLERSSVSYDELKDIVTVELNPIPLIDIDQGNDGTFSELVITDYFNGDYNALLTTNPTVKTRTDTLESIIDADTFLFNALELVTQRTSPQIFADLSGANYEWYITDRDYYTLTQMLGVIASLQGSVYGSFFDELFFVQRSLSPPSSPSTSIDWADVENVKEDIFFQSEFYGITLTQGSTTAGFTTNIVGDDVPIALNKYGEKVLNISFDGGGLFKGDTSATSNVGPSASADGELVDSGYDGYVSALGADGGIRLSVDVLGFQNIKPYFAVEFSSDAPTEYQSKWFRITEVEYDFLKYKTKLKIYEI